MIICLQHSLRECCIVGHTWFHGWEIGAGGKLEAQLHCMHMEMDMERESGHNF
jgi:hypothetical protein